MIVVYDGTFEGVLTLIFDFYKDIEDIEIYAENIQINFFEKKIIETDVKKSQRVKNSLIESFGKKFFNDIFLVFRSDYKDKEVVIANVVKGIYKYKFSYINSSEKYPIIFRRILSNIEKEIHTFKGLTRFFEISEGFLFAKISPHNDILEFLALHFIERMPREKFAIYDENRNKAIVYVKGESQIVEILDLKVEESDDEKIFKEAWRKFYDSVAIGQRKNTKLMQNNMPKKYWKNLPEKNRFI